MKNQVPKYVTRARAAYLLGLPVEELSRISDENGIGHRERTDTSEEWFFTYEELQKICIFATQSQAVAH